MELVLETVAELMFRIVTEAQGRKIYTTEELFKSMITNYEDRYLTRKECEAAIRFLIDSERLAYTYFNGPWIEMAGTMGVVVAEEESKTS